MFPVFFFFFSGSTFEGEEYNCVQKYTIPYMNKRIADGDAAFMVHAGDFISEF